MANVVYGDPFGSYVKGQEAGQQQAINLGEAERKFRDSDREADFRKWYDPHRKLEVQTKENMATMQQNRAQLQYLARAALTGSKQALNLIRQHIALTTGITDANPMQYDKNGQLDPTASALLASFVSGDIPSALLDTRVVQAGGITRMYNLGGYGGGAGATAPDPLGLNSNTFGHTGGQAQEGQSGQSGQGGPLPNLLAGQNPYVTYPQPGNEGAGIPVGDWQARPYPSVSGMPGDEQGGEMNTNGLELPHYDQGTADQNVGSLYRPTVPISGQTTFANPEETGRMAPNIPMNDNQVSFNSPDDTGSNPLPAVSYPPAGQAPRAIPIGTPNAPINLNPYKAAPLENRPTARKQFWADNAEKQFRINQQRTESQSARPAGGGVY